MDIFAIFWYSMLIEAFGVASANSLGPCPPPLSDSPNRDDEKPRFPLREDYRKKTANIENAHDVLRKGLQQYLEFRDADLETYLRHIFESDMKYFDEYGKEIQSYFKVFEFIWEQHNETMCKNYAINWYEKDKLFLCSAARFLSHQPQVKDRRTIMKRMGEALEYTCHPCTDYKPRQHGANNIPNTDNIIPLSPEESLIFCKGSSNTGQSNVPITSTTTESTTTTTFRTTTTPFTTTTSRATTTSPTTTTSRTTTTIPTTTTSPSTTTIPTTTTSRTTTTSTTTSRPTTTQAISVDTTNLDGSDYSPCSYSNGNVICDSVSIDDVKAVFRRTTNPTLDSVTLILRPMNGKPIPEDVLANKQTTSLKLEYPRGQAVPESAMKLQVDPNAFRSTKGHLKYLEINLVDCSVLDLKFLSGSDQLTNVTFSNILNIHRCFSSLPPLPNLNSLTLQFNTGMDELFNFPTLARGLKRFELWGSKPSNKVLNDEIAGRILDWVLTSSSNTLEEISLVRMTQLNHVPRQISYFKTLRRIWMSENDISVVKTGSFLFSLPASTLYLMDNQIREIEPNAFQGNFRDAKVYLDGNYLTGLDESVFGIMLKQMSYGKGFIQAYKNSIDCSKENICRMSWLKRYRAGPDYNMDCSDGTSFKDLKSDSFAHCEN